MGDQELPGFFRDPKTGKYFRDKPDDTNNPALKKIKVDVKEDLAKFKNPPRANNLLDYFNAREICAAGGVQDAKKYYKARLALKSEFHEADLSSLISMQSESVEINSVEFVKASDTGFYGIWNGVHMNRNKFIFGKTDYADENERNFYCKDVLGYVIDMCPGPLNTHIVLYNSSVYKVPYADFFPKISVQYAIGYEALYGSELFRPIFHAFSDTHLFCCSSSKDLSKIAFGGENMIFFYHAPYRGTRSQVDGQVHCISFDETSNLMAYGLHNGKLMLVDRRTDVQKHSRCVNVFNETLTDCAFYTSEKLLVAGANDKLIMVDLRKEDAKKTKEIHAATYFGHKQSVKKQFFSVMDDLLCSRGCDNVVRVWDINGGAPVCEMYPSENNENKIHGFLSKVKNRTKLCCFEEFFRNSPIILNYLATSFEPLFEAAAECVKKNNA